MFEEVTFTLRCQLTPPCLKIFFLLETLVSIATETTEKNMIGSRVPLLSKECVAPSRRSSADCMPESSGRLSIRVGRKHLVTMRKASYREHRLKKQV